MNTSKNVSALIARLETAAASLAGKKGVTEARAKLARIQAAASQHRANMRVPGRSGVRSAYQIERGQARRAAKLADLAAGGKVTALGIDAAVYPLLELTGGAGGQCARVGGWWVSSDEDVSKDWDFYSKAWHRSHGPKVTVESRTVMIRRVDAQGRVEKRDQPVSGWRGNWALAALMAAGVLESVKVPTRLRGVQLHPAYHVALVRAFGELEIYRRSLAGDTADYCAIWHGLTFHASTQRLAVAGLRQKFAAAEQRRNSPIDWDFCRSLGFCETGIRQFCRDFDLDPKGRYTAEQVRQTVERDLNAAAPYAGELRTLARVVGYKLPTHLAA